MPPAQVPALAAVNAASGASTQKPATPEPKTTPQTPTVLAADPVADLINRVEAEYQAGQDNYRAGHLEAAKQNFDSAFNQLLGSGLDLHSDDRLEHELDRILARARRDR